MIPVGVEEPLRGFARCRFREAISLAKCRLLPKEGAVLRKVFGNKSRSWREVPRMIKLHLSYGEARVKRAMILRNVNHFLAVTTAISSFSPRRGPKSPRPWATSGNKHRWLSLENPAWFIVLRRRFQVTNYNFTSNARPFIPLSNLFSRSKIMSVLQGYCEAKLWVRLRMSSTGTGGT